MIIYKVINKINNKPQVGGNGGANKGMKWSGKTKERHSTAMKLRNLVPWNKNTEGIVKSNSGSFKKGENVGENNPFYGQKHTKESKAKISEANRKRKGIAKARITCPHCDKIGGSNLMKRYHFDNCKYIG